MTAMELSYIAGLWDGEGCFTIGLSPKKNRRKSPYWFAVASICMTDKTAIKFIQQLFGGSIGCYTRKGVGKDVYEWKLWSRKASAFASRLLPFLKVKNRAARILISFQKYVDRLNTRYVGGKLLTVTDKRHREKFRQRIKLENRRGKV